MEFNTLKPELYVTDFQKSLDFYKNIMGCARATPTYTHPSFAAVGLGSSYELEELFYPYTINPSNRSWV